MTVGGSQQLDELVASAGAVLNNATDDDREFWLTVRRSIIMVLLAIDKRYKLPPKD